MAAADGDITVRDVLAIVGLLGPVVMVAGATTVLHEMAWWLQAGALFAMPWWQQVPDAPVWAVWLAVAVFSLFRLRRTAAVGAWLGTAGMVLVALADPPYYRWTSVDAGVVLLGVVTAIALTLPSGRGRELATSSATKVMVWAVVAAVVSGTLGYGTTLGQLLSVVALVWGTVAACGFRSRVGRGAAVVLLLPVMTTVLGAAMFDVMHQMPDVAVAAIFYGVPVLALVVLSSRIGWRGKITE
jgi:hypothetical protein